MRIGLLLDPYGEEHPGGLGRFVYELARELVETSPEDVFTVCTRSSERPPFLRNQDTHIVLGAGSVWSRLGGMFDETLDCHVFFTPVIPLFFSPKRLIVFALDFAYLELVPLSFMGRIRAVLLRYLHAGAFKRADKIIAISEATKKSLLRFFPSTPHEKVTVIYPGYVVRNIAPVEFSVPQPYFLFSGVFKERKNVKRIIEAFKEASSKLPEHHLVLTGKKSGPYYDACVAYVAEHNLSKRVHFVGYVSDGELAYLLHHAEALVFVSLVEGFGMPVLEAMNAGTPVITSSTGALAEIVADAALKADPYDVYDIREAMRHIAENAELRNELVHKSRERVGEFAWSKAARELTGLLQTGE